MLIFDYIPKTYTNKYRTDVKYLLRKRIFGEGYQLSYCYLPANEEIWIHLTDTLTKQDALNIIDNSHH